MKSFANLKTFVRVAEVQSFAQASNSLGLSTSAVSKAVARLEADLGVKLFHRSTRSVSLTPDGLRFYDGCHQLLVEFDALIAEVQGSQTVPQGRLTISVSPAFGRLCVVPLLKSFTQAYPEITLEITMDDRAVDMAAAGIDIVLRAGNLADSANLIASRLVTYSSGVCGAPSYFLKYGEPQHPDELSKYVCLSFRNRDTGRLYPWVFNDRREARTYAGNRVVVLDNADAVVRSAISGLGISQMPLFLAKEAIETGQLVEVLKPYRPPETSLWICYLDRRFVSHRIRAFVEFMMSHKDDISTMCTV